MSSYLVFSRHLFDPSHRETYESAHSVILSIFASHAQHQQHTGDSISDTSTQTSPATATNVCNIPNNGTSVLSGRLNTGDDNKHGSEDERAFISISNSHKEAEESIVAANFVKRMVPFYAQCLIEVGVLLCSYFGFFACACGGKDWVEINVVCVFVVG